MTSITQNLSTILDPTLLGAMFYAQLILIVVYVNFLINKFYKHFYLYNLYNFVLLEIFDIILYGSSVRLYGSSVAKVVVTKQPAKSMYYLAVVISFPKLPSVKDVLANAHNHSILAAVICTLYLLAMYLPAR